MQTPTVQLLIIIIHFHLAGFYDNIERKVTEQNKWDIYKVALVAVEDTYRIENPNNNQFNSL
ncbi:hypothetical protein [Nostoc sp.]